MLKDNLKTLRKNKGLSQEELSIKLHVVRQTISKWESGLSVPDAEMLMTISEIFETPVSKILGESIDEKEKNDLKVISEKLEVINEQLAMKQKQKRKIKYKYMILTVEELIEKYIKEGIKVFNEDVFGTDLYNNGTVKKESESSETE